MSSYPQTWTITNLFEVCQPRQWKTISTKELTQAGYTVYGANGVIGFYNQYTHEAPTLMITCRGATCGNLHISKPFSYINGNAMALDHLNESICSMSYLHRFLQARGFDDVISGSAQPQITQEGLRKVDIPIAPRQEQKRIADKLDTVLTRVDAVNTRLARVAPLLKRFRQSVLAAATSGRLTEDWRISSNLDDSSTSERVAEILFKRKEMWNGRGKYTLPFAAADVSSAAFLDIPKSWIRGTLDQVAWSVKDGPHFSPEYTSQGIPFISGRNIRPGKIDLSNAKFISKELHAELSQRCKPSYGDVLYTKGGTTGIAAVNTLSADFNVWVHVAVLKLLPPAFVDPFFVQHALNSPACYEQSQLYTHGVGNQDLGLTRMIKIILPIPPVQEQAEIVRRVETLFAFADRLEARLAQAQTAATRLTPALLAKAFRGELVPQDPNDEPAAELLRRLQAERASAPKASAGRGRKAVVQSEG